MKIYLAVKKDLGTGSITGASQQSYVVPYYIVADNGTTPYAIYEQARSEAGIILSELVNTNKPRHVQLVTTKDKLPVYGTIDLTTYVSNISIERASENNLSSVPGYGLAPLSQGSYTCWNYVVTFTASDTTTVITGEAPWNKDEAISCSFAPKTYERYDNKTLVPNYSEKGDSIVVPNYPLNEAKYSNLQNTVGDDLYRSRTIYNYVLNFSYAVRNFDAQWLPLYMNTMNLKDCVICGLPIKKYGAVINEMRVEQAEWNGKTYYNVNVEVEIQYQQRLTYDEYVSSGHRAYMIEGSTTAINSYLTSLQSGLTKEKAGFVYKYTNSSTAKKYPVPIEELTDVRQRDKIPDRRWFMKKKNLGYFEEIFKNVDNTETVPITRRVFITNNSLGQSTIKVSKVNPDSSEYDSSKDIQLYFVKQNDENDYVYSVVQGSTAENNLRYMTTGIAVVDNNAELLYYMTKYVIRHTTTKEPADPFQGQYNSIQSPLALNKFGGVYFSNTETSTVDNVTEPAKIDMYDPMLGKVKDYQHIARDWTALGFPKRGMFWSVTGDTNFMMNKVSKYFK